MFHFGFCLRYPCSKSAFFSPAFLSPLRLGNVNTCQPYEQIIDFCLPARDLMK